MDQTRFAMGINSERKGFTMTQGNDQPETEQLPGKKGRRPANLAPFADDPSFAKEIQCLDCAILDDRDWFVRYTGYFLLHLRDGKDCSAFQVLPAMKLHIADRIRALREKAARLEFEESPTSDQWLPSLQLTGVRRERAIELSRAFLQLAQSNPYLVRSVALRYCYGVSARMRIVLTGYRDAEFGRKLLRLVDLLKVSWLAPKLVGFKVQGQKPDLTCWLHELQPHPETERAFQDAPNQSSPVSLNYIGIVVTETPSGWASRAFHEVLVVASIIELWRCVRPLADKILPPGLEQTDCASIPSIHV
jgi:hypothetical protein